MVKKKRNVIIGAIIVFAVLAGAFFLGGQLPESGGAIQAVSQEQKSGGQEEAGYGEKETESPGNGGKELSAEEKIKAAEKIAEDAPSQSVKNGNTKGENTETVKKPTAVQSSNLCTLSISCASVLNRMDWLDPAKKDLIPGNGWILSPVSVSYKEGDSAFDVLQRTCREKGIHMEFQKTPAYNSIYIEGINNLYEFDCGDLSGWLFKANGTFLNYSSSQYKVQSGDEISFVYSCDLGVDVGGFSSAVQ